MRSPTWRLKAIQGGKAVPPDTPEQRFAEDLVAYTGHYLKRHSGITALEVTKVFMQISASMALDYGAQREDYLRACGHVFDEEYASRVGTGR